MLPPVVDASVVLKWVLPEPGRAEALTLRDGYEAGGLDLFAQLAEVASPASRSADYRAVARNYPFVRRLGEN